ncbi:fungal-specific transcription factor domain-containing protein [Phellopilus nigrolimitatus]|nr:fungal-specific transcription factor domain-containing protein [Phellopilus nigrolimitatus]
MSSSPGPGPSSNVEPFRKRRPGRIASSCAECRRMKLKCDRKKPCENCVKRGCASICPDGAQTPIKGSRLVLSNTEELSGRLNTLRERAHQLENALKEFQLKEKSTVNSYEEELSEASVSHTDISPNLDACGTPDVAHDEKLVDSFGALSIGELGETDFYGQTARSDLLIQVLHEECTDKFRSLPKFIYECTWPEPPQVKEGHEEKAVRKLIFDCLPPLAEACTMCRTYLEYGKYLGIFVPRRQMFEDLVGVVYDTACDISLICPYRVALLYMVFALAILWDPSKPLYSLVATRYYRLARASLALLKSPTTEPTVVTVQVISEMTRFLFYSDFNQSSMQAWVMSGLGLKISCSMGLNRDSSTWNLDERLSEKRHMAFWQCYVVETTLSMFLGRPPLLRRAYIDCPLPTCLEDDDDPEQAAYFRWFFETSKLTNEVSEEAFSAKPFAYDTIIALDRTLRMLPIPPTLRLNCARGIECELLQRPDVAKMRVKDKSYSYLCPMITVLLHLHRSFLLEALAEYPADLMKSNYSPSIMACYRSAYRLIEGLDWAYCQVPKVVERHGNWFGSMVSSMIVMSLLVARAPRSGYASPAMEKIEQGYCLLEKVADRNRVASRNLGATELLLKSARDAISGRPDSIANEHWSELERLGGKTHLASRTSHDDAQRTFNEEGTSTSRFVNLLRSQCPAEEGYVDHLLPGVSEPFPFETIMNPDLANLGNGDFIAHTQNTVEPFVTPNALSQETPMDLDANWQEFISMLGF